MAHRVKKARPLNKWQQKKAGKGMDLGTRVGSGTTATAVPGVTKMPDYTNKAPVARTSARERRLAGTPRAAKAPNAYARRKAGGTSAPKAEARKARQPNAYARRRKSRGSY